MGIVISILEKRFERLFKTKSRSGKTIVKMIVKTSLRHVRVSLYLN